MNPVCVFRPVMSVIIIGATMARLLPAGPCAAWAGATPPEVITAARTARRPAKFGRAHSAQFQANARLLHASVPAWPEIRGDPRTPATAIHPSSAPQAAAWRRALPAAGILPIWTRHPTGPAAGLFRFAVRGAHPPAQVRRLAAALRAGFANSA